MRGDAIRLEISWEEGSACRRKGSRGGIKEYPAARRAARRGNRTTRAGDRATCRGETTARRVASHQWDCHRTRSKTLESLANPLESLRVRLQAALWSVAERASDLGVLLVDYSKPGSAHSSQQRWEGHRKEWERECRCKSLLQRLS